MKTTLILSLFVILGYAIHYISKIRDAKTKQEVFPYRRQLKSSIASLIVILVIIPFRTHLIAFFPSLSLPGVIDNYILWFLIGYTGDSIIKNVMRSEKTMLSVPSTVEGEEETNKPTDKPLTT